MVNLTLHTHTEGKRQQSSNRQGSKRDCEEKSEGKVSGDKFLEVYNKESKEKGKTKKNV